MFCLSIVSYKLPIKLSYDFDNLTLYQNLAVHVV